MGFDLFDAMFRFLSPSLQGTVIQLRADQPSLLKHSSNVERREDALF